VRDRGNSHCEFACLLLGELGSIGRTRDVER